MPMKKEDRPGKMHILYMYVESYEAMVLATITLTTVAAAAIS